MLTLCVGFTVKEQWMTSPGAAGDVAALSVVKPCVGASGDIYVCVWARVRPLVIACGAQ